MMRWLRQKLVALLLRDDLSWETATCCPWCGEKIGATDLLHDMRIGLALPRGLSAEQVEEWHAWNEDLFRRAGEMFPIPAEVLAHFAKAP